MLLLNVMIPYSVLLLSEPLNAFWVIYCFTLFKRCETEFMEVNQKLSLLFVISTCITSAIVSSILLP